MLGKELDLVPFCYYTLALVYLNELLTKKGNETAKYVQHNFYFFFLFSEPVKHIICLNGILYLFRHLLRS